MLAGKEEVLHVSCQWAFVVYFSYLPYLSDKLFEISQVKTIVSVGTNCKYETQPRMIKS